MDPWLTALPILGWLADHSPPLIAGFLGGIVGNVALERWHKRRQKTRGE